MLQTEPQVHRLTVDDVQVRVQDVTLAGGFVSPDLIVVERLQALVCGPAVDVTELLGPVA